MGLGLRKRLKIHKLKTRRQETKSNCTNILNKKGRKKIKRQARRCNIDRAAK